MDYDLEKFHEVGFAGPFKLFGQPEADELLKERYIPSNVLTWFKSTHEKSVGIVKTASHPTIVNKVGQLIGKDILLWGSHFIGQPPGRAHSWHLDVEHGSWNGITLWLGLKNLNQRTTVSLISHSHLLDTAPQELRKKFGISTSDDDAILMEAKKLDPRCELKTFTLKPGEFIIWSGRVWHTTLNRSLKKRFSIIMQFCSPNQEVKIPINYEYPGTTWSDVKPPCVLIDGADNYRLNKVFSKSDLNSSDTFLRKLIFVRYKARYLVGAIKRKIFRGVV